ncbi:MAG: hypothetical protein H0T69_14435 [Thermoleophilaceae bacterium]|nr:hypothetical protein [Thermoleophilaceae bacterium]
MKHASVVFVLALLGLCGTPVATAVAGGPEERMIEKIDAARAAEGLPALRTAPNLNRSAGAFAQWLLGHEQLAHRPAVSTTRSYPHCGEALAMRFSLQPQVGATVRTWLQSPAHRGLVLTSSMNLLGVGHARGRLAGRPRTVWVIQVARR